MTNESLNENTNNKEINNNFLDIEAGEVSGSGYREFIVSS